jgi:hypothetical protein
MLKKLILFSLLSVTMNMAYADCVYDGKKYASGASVGPLVCVNGKWKRP